MKTAKLFENGRSQAVRLPKECRFRGKEVYIRKYEDIVILFISVDLPFAQKRFCQSFDITKVKTFSDHKTADFGNKYGVLIEELRLLSRAIFVIDKSDMISYVEYVKEVADQPDYDRVLDALKKTSAE